METNIKNNLWQARARASLKQKQVAVLLSKKSTDEISRYERGLYLPSLKAALKFEIIYQMPVRLLFQELFEQLRYEISDARRAAGRGDDDRQVNSFEENRWFVKNPDQLKQEEFCFYSELLKSHVPSPLEIETINKHTVALVNTLSDYKQGRNPFSL